jgi:hypothetical protein
MYGFQFLIYSLLMSFLRVTSCVVGVEWMIWDLFLAEARDFSLLRNVLTDSGTHPASYSLGTMVLSLSIKQLVCDVDHSHPYSAVVKNEWNYTSAPVCAFMVCTETALPSPVSRAKFSL